MAQQAPLGERETPEEVGSFVAPSSSPPDFAHDDTAIQPDDDDDDDDEEEESVSDIRTREGSYEQSFDEEESVQFYGEQVQGGESGGADGSLQSAGLEEEEEEYGEDSFEEEARGDENSVLSSLGEEIFPQEEDDEDSQPFVQLQQQQQQQEEDDDHSQHSTGSSVLRTSMFSDSGSFDTLGQLGGGTDSVWEEHLDQPSFDQEHQEHLDLASSPQRDQRDQRDQRATGALRVRDETLEESDFDALGALDYQEDMGGMSGAIELELEEEEEGRRGGQARQNPFDAYDYVEEARLASSRQGSNSF